MSNAIKENCVSGLSACLDHCTMTTQDPGIWNSKQQVSTDLHEHTWTRPLIRKVYSTFNSCN